MTPTTDGVKRGLRVRGSKVQTLVGTQVALDVGPGIHEGPGTMLKLERLGHF